MDNTSSTYTPIHQKYQTYDVNQDFAVYEDEEECLMELGQRAYAPAGSSQLFCNGTFDGVLCWPAAPAMSIARQHCPPLQSLDTSMYGKRKCGALGLWEGRSPNDNALPNGWTNYTECYPPEMLDIYNKIFGKENSELLKRIASGCKLMEMIGLSVSLCCLVFSIFIFLYFRSLRCHRTRIHCNLFVAISIHISIQLIVNTDELIGQSTGSAVAGGLIDRIGMINNTPILCELVRRVLIEYTKTVMFMWMFIEGMYLHNTLVISVFSGKPDYVLYACLGWGFPACLTISWAIPTWIFDKNECWFGYTFRPLFWLIEGPRALIILINLGFLLNIIRVLVTKLQNSNSTEALKVRKAVKAAIVLLPLLGVNNAFALVEAPVDKAIKFAIFTVVSVFLISFQGFFIALLYCFLNGEVQQTIRRYWINPYLQPDRIRANDSSNVRRTLARKWDRFLIRKGYRNAANGNNNKRRSETMSTSPLNNETTAICAELNGVAIGRIAEKTDYEKTQDPDLDMDEFRRESNDSGYEHEESIRAESSALIGSPAANTNQIHADSKELSKSTADSVVVQL